MVLRVVYDTFTEEFLNSFVMNLVSFPAYVNLAHWLQSDTQPKTRGMTYTEQYLYTTHIYK